MRPLPLIASATLAAATSLQPRQDHVAQINGATTSGSLCQPGTVAIEYQTTAVTVGLRDVSLDAIAGPTSGDCTLEVSMTFPPGCTTAVIGTNIHLFLQGSEEVVTFVELTGTLSTGGVLLTTSDYRNNEGVPLETEQGAYENSWLMNASVSGGGEEPVEATFTVLVDSRIESADGSDGIYHLDDVTVWFDMSSLDESGEACATP